MMRSSLSPDAPGRRHCCYKSTTSRRGVEDAGWLGDQLWRFGPPGHIDVAVSVGKTKDTMLPRESTLKTQCIDEF